MDTATVKDITAYKITRQITDHIYGSDEKISNEEFIFIYHIFIKCGGSWEKLMNGDMESVKILEKVLDQFVKNRSLLSIAAKVAFPG